MYQALPLDIAPGIYKEASEYAAMGRFVDGRNVRFRKGFAERIGGNTEIAAQRTLRPARSMVAWQALDGTQIIAMGHAYGVEILQGGILYDISPVGSGGYQTLLLPVDNVSGTFTAGNAITSANGGTGTITTTTTSSPIRICADNGTHRVTLTSVTGTFITGETITADGGGTARVRVGGTTTLGVYDYTGTWSGTVTGSSSGATGTYSATVVYWDDDVQVEDGSTGATADMVGGPSFAGNVDSGATRAFGESTYGTSVWGGSDSLYATVIDATTWTLDLWGEDLVACPREGGIYTLDTSAWVGDSSTNMTLISGAPSDALGIFMNSDNRTLIAYGAHDGSASDPLNIRWCDEENFTDWTATPDNSAGSIRCEDGSFIIGRMPARGGHLISTDTAIYLFRYIGRPFYFGLNKIAVQSTLIGPHASAELDGVTYWMGRDGFHYYNGTVLPLPCDVHNYVFDRLNTVQSFKVVCATLREFDEVWWFYASTGSSEIDSYVAYNAVEQTWHIGDKARTAAMDASVVIAYAAACEADGTINAEEFGSTDNGASITYDLTTSELEIGDGTGFLQARKLIPDYDRIEGSHEVTIKTRGWPARTQRTKGPYAVTAATEDISVRARGRVMSLTFSGSDDFRMGRWRMRARTHGQKDG